MKTNETKTTKRGPRCCGTRVTIDGTFNCDRKPVAAYSWDGVPFLFNGKPGAAACDEHQFAIYAGHTTPTDPKYPNLKLIEVLKKPKTIKDLLEDPRVTDFSDERGSEDGIWLYLVSGLCSDPQTHAVHEDTVKEAISYLNDVKPCDCADCKSEAAAGDGLPMFAKKIRKMQASQGVR